MSGPQTFVEKILGAPAGSIVFRKPDLVLSHDNTASIKKTFEKMAGEKVIDPDQLLIVLDHNAPPTSAKLATDYQLIRDFVNTQAISRFYDAGRGICHQIMSYHARPGMLIVGSDSHTCTAGAFNALAAGIDRTETAGLWRRGETWFRVPESMKIILRGSLRKGVYAKDLSLWIIAMIGSAGANYMSIEYHGEGVSSLSISDRMCIANLASEMGAKNAVFPADRVLSDFLSGDDSKDDLADEHKGAWADEEAVYATQIEIDLSEIIPLAAAPHHVDNIVPVDQVRGKKVQQGLIGTCTNGRLEDLRIAADILKDKTIAPQFQLLVVPASREIYLQAVEEGIISTLIRSGANVLSSSCGPCLGTGQGIPADGYTVISTANRNFLGRMGNKNAEIYLASPATVAYSALRGEISLPDDFSDREEDTHLRSDSGQGSEANPFSRDGKKSKPSVTEIPAGENRKAGRVWNYSDIDNLSTDQMFAGDLTYNVLSSDPEAIIPHLFKGFDTGFSANAAAGDIIVAGDNFGCGSSREHPSVGLAHIGISAVIVKSVNRIFFRSAINQGLVLIVHREFVENFSPGTVVNIDMVNGLILSNETEYPFAPLPAKLNEVIEKKGLVNWIRDS